MNIINSTLRGLVDEKAEMETAYMSKSQYIRPTDSTQPNYWRSSSNTVSNAATRESINQLRESFRGPEWLTKTPITTSSAMEASRRILSNPHQSYDSQEIAWDGSRRSASRQFLRTSIASPRAYANTSMRGSTLFHSSAPISLSPMARSILVPDQSQSLAKSPGIGRLSLARFPYLHPQRRIPKSEKALLMTQQMRFKYLQHCNRAR